MRVFGDPKNRDKEQKQKLLNDTERIHAKDIEVAYLTEKISFLESIISDTRHREEWLKGQVDKLTETIKLLESTEKKQKK